MRNDVIVDGSDVVLPKGEYGIIVVKNGGVLNMEPGSVAEQIIIHKSAGSIGGGGSKIDSVTIKAPAPKMRRRRFAR